MNNKWRPITAVTMGDPAGVGPEICAACFAQPALYVAARPLLIGNEAFLRRALELKQVTLDINVVSSVRDAKFQPGTIDLYAATCDATTDIPYGAPCDAAAKWAHAFFTASIQLAKAGEVDAISTAPINKDSLKQAGFAAADHSAILKQAFPHTKTTSMFHCREIKTFHYTRHMSLLGAIQALDVQALAKTIRQVNDTMLALQYAAPRIAVAALNPHASDNGLFGEEEAKYLVPAVELCRQEGLGVYGPVPADSVYYLQRQGQFDCVLSLFHDQGHIACKTYDFEHSVSLTFGYPFMRSTVDHGTAYDIAGKGTASCENLKEAIVAAAAYCALLEGGR